MFKNIGDGPRPAIQLNNHIGNQTPKVEPLSGSLENSLAVVEKKLAAGEAHDAIKDAVDKAREDWDRYFLSEMIPDEQKLADETTPLLDKAYGSIDNLLKKLQTADIADLSTWRNDTLRPALADGAANLKQLIAMQLVSANLDLEQAKSDYQAALRNTIALLAGGVAGRAIDQE